MPTGAEFHRKVILVFQLSNKYPIDGALVQFATLYPNKIDELYNLNYSLSGLFKQVYADSLKDIFQANLSSLFNIDPLTYQTWTQPVPKSQNKKKK